MDFPFVPRTWRFNRSDVTFQLAALSFSKAFPELLYTYFPPSFNGRKALARIPISLDTPEIDNALRSEIVTLVAARKHVFELLCPSGLVWARTWLTSARMDTSRCLLHFILSHSITCMLNVSVSCRGHDMLSKLLRFWKAWNSVISSIWVWGTR